MREFGSWTAALVKMAQWLVRCGIRTVAMQSTGVYWIVVNDVLQKHGLKVFLVDARATNNVPGRKSDVQECQWLMRLHTYGLLRACFLSAQEIQRVRTVWRLRDQHVRDSSRSIQHMQKCLIAMNMQLHNALSEHPFPKKGDVPECYSHHGISCILRLSPGGWQMDFRYPFLEVHVFELILDQRYRVNGIPVDLSPYRNHGSGIGTVGVPGPDPGESAVTFQQPGSQVAINPTAAQGWSSLVAVKVEIVAQVDTLLGGGGVQGLADARGAFTFEIFENAIAARFPDGTQVRADSSYSPDHLFHPIAPKRWVTLGLLHDGYAKVQLTMDGKVVGQANVTSGVPPLQGAVTIGNVRGGGKPLLGEIDSVSVWRLDPKAVQREFLCRPFTPKTAACWEKIFGEVGAWMKAAGDAPEALLNLIFSEQRKMIHDLKSLPDEAQAEIQKELRKILRLLCAGHLHGEDMRQAIRYWLRLLAKYGLDTNRTANINQVEGIFSHAPAKRPKLDLACDPGMEAFFALIAEEEKHSQEGKP